MLIFRLEEEDFNALGQYLRLTEFSGFEESKMSVMAFNCFRLHEKVPSIQCTCSENTRITENITTITLSKIQTNIRCYNACDLPVKRNLFLSSPRPVSIEMQTLHGQGKRVYGAIKNELRLFIDKHTQTCVDRYLALKSLGADPKSYGFGEFKEIIDRIIIDSEFTDNPDRGDLLKALSQVNLNLFHNQRDLIPQHGVYYLIDNAANYPDALLLCKASIFDYLLKLTDRAFLTIKNGNLSRANRDAEALCQSSNYGEMKGPEF